MKDLVILFILMKPLVNSNQFSALGHGVTRVHPRFHTFQWAQAIQLSRSPRAFAQLRGKEYIYKAARARARATIDIGH